MTASQDLFERSQRFIPGGVNSPVRAFGAVGGTPPFIDRAEGPFVFDADGKRYIDYVGSWGPMILGHAHPDVVQAVQRKAACGLSFGAPTEIELRMAELLCKRVPGMQQVRLVNSGTEATMSAIRLARGFTGRDLIIKFEGCYHGHADALLVSAGSGALTFGNPTSPGIPADTTRHTLVLPYNRLDSVKAAFAEHGDKIAAIIVEPVAGNMNCVPPVDGFLAGLRQVCDAHQSLLIFDEVMTGFRVGPQGAQGRYGVTADLITLGKVIGGGLPVGAFGGRKDVMQALAPSGPVYQAGTLSGNPVTLAAGLATLELLDDVALYERLEVATRKLLDGIEAAAEKAGIGLVTNQVGAMFGLFFTDGDRVRYYEDVMACSADRFKQFFHAMLERGVYIAPSAFEAGFISAAHDDDTIEQTIAAAAASFAELG